MPVRGTASVATSASTAPARDAGVGVEHEQVVAGCGVAGAEVDAGGVAAVATAAHELDGGARAATRSMVPSRDPLSTTTTGTSGAWAASASRQPPTTAALSYVTTIAVTPPRGAPDRWRSSGSARVGHVARRTSSSTTDRISRSAPGSG